MLTKKPKQPFLNRISCHLGKFQQDLRPNSKKITIICMPRQRTHNEDKKEEFYSSLQTSVNTVPKHDIALIMCDLNAKVGSKRMERESEMGPRGIGNSI